MTTDAERLQRYAERTAAPTEVPEPGFTLTATQIRALTPGRVQALLRDGHEFTDSDMVALHHNNRSAWAEVRDHIERQRDRAETKPAAAPEPPVQIHASPSDARTLGAMLMRLTAVMQAPVRPVYNERGVLVRGERDLSAVPDAPEIPAPEPKPAPKVKGNLALLRRILNHFTPIIREDREAILDLRARVEALEAKPHMRYRNVWMSAQQYAPGDICTHDGSMWHANEATSDRPGTSSAWTLAVKRGKDAR